MTTSHFIRVMDTNPNLSITEADKKFGRPKMVFNINSTTLYKIYTVNKDFYSDVDIAVYFVNNKVFRFSEDSPFFHLDVSRDLGFITQEQYEEKYNQLVKEQESRRAGALKALEMMSTMQNMQYQQQSLYNQQQLINQNKEFLKTYKQQNQQKQVSPILQIHKPTTYNTDCYTDYYGRTHCTTMGN